MTTATENPFAYPQGGQAPAAPTPVPAVAPPAPPAPAAPAAPPAPAGDVDPFEAPAPRADRPRPRDIYGRLVLVVPKRLEENVRNQMTGELQNRLTADVIVLDGGELHFGGAPEKTPPIPHTKTVQVPYKIDDMYISAPGIITACREALRKRKAGQIGMVLGRWTVGEASRPGHNPPYLLREYTQEEAAVARAYLAANPINPF